MGTCCAGSRTDKGEAMRLKELFKLNDKDFVKLGRRKDMDRLYDILNCDMQSHPNVYGNYVNEKKTSMPCFCKLVERNDDMKGDAFGRAIDMMTSVSHSRVVKVKEIYADSHAIYLISESLSGSYKNLIDCGVLEESALA